jgi:hypothetical protein
MVCAGWQVVMVAYIDKIDGLYRKMFGILPDILPANLSAVNRYLTVMWKNFYRTTEAFERRYVSVTIVRQRRR